MKVKDLAGADPEADLLVYQPDTDDEVPVVVRSMRYGGPVVLEPDDKSSSC